MKPEGGTISVCSYCGEQCGSSQKYCQGCRTQDGRKKIYEANVKIAEENKEKGFVVPERFKNWK